jgi:hypothetical protein
MSTARLAIGATQTTGGERLVDRGLFLAAFVARPLPRGRVITPRFEAA